jgi:hypothetical protein
MLAASESYRDLRINPSCNHPMANTNISNTKKRRGNYPYIGVLIEVLSGVLSEFSFFNEPP